ncbi:hypothetical protein FEM48_Zijuj12G0097500 [Ziziphus jujuba var. spinosa]|uniref:DUF4283 domain-containing protein n=1 Tax=Ziziphus jujuba var. spinosa TaxID=714518 RepID=A0A978UCK9_ZIZJJ|nr:hypothetical protein FEM48_Zijuj12G0097500 [Ziziphus jujuba var. spinosa]
MDGTLKHLPHRDVPQLELVAYEENALRISQLKLVGKVMTEKVIRKNVVNPSYEGSGLLTMWLWSIDGAHLVMKEWKSELTFDNLNFNLSTFWVQIHGDQYGPWIRSEVGAYTMVKENNYLRRGEITRGEIFGTFSRKMNPHAKATKVGRELEANRGQDPVGLSRHASEEGESNSTERNFEGKSRGKIGR